VTSTASPIIDNERLAAAMRRYAAGPRLALDTEFLRERTYLAELALLQLGNGAEIALVDPLAALDLAPLAELLTRASLPKVLHAARQDIEVLLPLTGVPLTPVLDTQLAAALLGMPAQIGYADLVARELGHALEKSQARTDWTRRPLSAAQLEYAADDVRWLLPLAERLEQRLDALGRLPWLHEDCARLSDPALYRIEAGDAWQRLKGVESLPPAEQVRLRTLAAWREARALRRNLPRGWVLADDGLRLIARAAPRELAELRALGAMPPGAVDKLGAEILAELARARALPLDGIVQRAETRPDAEEQARTRRLGERLKALALELSLAPEVLATQRDLRRIARGEAVATVLRGWRAQLLSEPLEAAAAGA
jgi:ribonuclease D